MVKFSLENKQKEKESERWPERARRHDCYKYKPDENKISTCPTEDWEFTQQSKLLIISFICSFLDFGWKQKSQIWKPQI